MLDAATTFAAMAQQPLVAAGDRPLPGPRDEVNAALLRRAVEESDQGAWRALVETHYPAVLRQAMRACGDASTAEDIAQEVFLKVFRAGRAYRGDRPLAHWIARITTTTTIDVLRRRPLPPAPLDEAGSPAPDGDPADTVARNAHRHRVREAVMHLPGHLRDVIWLTVYANLSYEDAARELGIPLRTAMSRSLAARAQLRRALAGLEDGA